MVPPSAEAPAMPAAPPAPPPPLSPSLVSADPRPAQPAPHVEDEAALDGPLSFAIEARQLSITLTAATLAYRITLSNSGKTPLHDVAIAGDMISAHASLSQDQQLASLNSALNACHSIARIPPGQTVQVMGEFRLPLPLIQPIRRGDAALFVPLARLRVEATGDGKGVMVKTALIGQRSTRPGGVLQPFRLDPGPRIYREVTQKIFS